MAKASDRTTVSLSKATRDRLDDAAPDGSSWDDRVNALLDEYLDDSGVEAPDDVATASDIEGLRDDLLAQLPNATADEVLDRRR